MRTDKLAVLHKKATPKTDTHCTPKPFFEAVQKRLKLKFTLDAAASKKNTLCKNFYTKESNGLEHKWKNVVWCNPPYSLAYEFVQKAFLERSKALSVLLVAARTDTEWWHAFASKASSIIFIKGRLKFVDAEAGAPFPSVLLLFDKVKCTDQMAFWSPTPYERGFNRGAPKL